jgi:hypothetical protein
VKNWIKNWLGINALALTVVTVRKDYDKLTTQVDELEATDLSDVESRLDDVEEKQNELDPDDFVKSGDLDDQIEQWMSNSDYCDRDAVRDVFEQEAEEISDNLDEKITEVVEEQVKELAGGSSSPSKEELKELIKVVLEEMVKKLAEAK